MAAGPHRLQHPLIGKAVVALVGVNEVVENRQIQEIAGFFELLSELNIGGAGAAVAAGVVMDLIQRLFAALHFDYGHSVKIRGRAALASGEWLGLCVRQVPEYFGPRKQRLVPRLASRICLSVCGRRST